MKPLIFISLFIIGSTFAESVKQVSEADCKEGERFVTCASCEPTCGNQNPICTMQCRPPQCVCENGKVRHSNGKCVLPAECQATNDTFVPIRPPVLPPPRDNNGTQQQQCGRNEFLNQCSGCPENQCGRPQIMCKMICNNIPKCMCDSGFFRNNQTGQCIAENECPEGSSDGHCGENETLKNCPGCEPSCQTPTPFCPKICKEGQACECSEGFVRNDAGKCVKQIECPKTGNNTCGANEGLKTCPGCEPTCANPNPICPAICRLGQACQCLAGFVRNEAGKCVKQTECASSGNNTCGTNEGLKSCPGCEPTCANPTPICPMICRPGQACQCLAGFVRNEAGKCVKQTQCAASGNNTQCKENETLKNCPGCEASCSNPNPVCIEICRPGQACECSQGFVRNDAGKCVKQSECGATGNNTVTECAENERLTQCSGCEANCANLDRMCPMMCNMIPKCECASGFARNSENKCVSIDQCSNTRNPRDNGTQTPPNQCQGKNEVLTSCPGCEPSCANKNPVCTMACRLGQECQCQKGFYRNTDGKCVKESECNSAPSNSSNSCPKNEVFTECGGCEGSCTNHNPICTLQCRPAGCYCPVGKGFVRGPKGHCIHRSVCQKRLKDAIANNDEDEEYNPCSATSCPINSTCEVIKVQCVKAPCPAQARCKLATNSPPNQTRPSRSPPVVDNKCMVVRCTANTTCVDGKCIPNTQENPCATVLCAPGSICKLQQVVCVRAPCNPVPVCQSLNETRPSRSPPVVVPIDPPQQNPCASMLCAANTRCEIVQVNPPQGRCVPLNETHDPTEDRFVRGPKGHCIHRSLCQKRLKDAIANNDEDEEYNPCAATSCPINSTCEVIKVQCVKAPCPPQARCKLATNSPPNPCDSMMCPPNTVCKLNQVQCFTTPCPPIPECQPLNETRPSRSPPVVDKCATMFCTADSTCIDGKCVPLEENRPPRTVPTNKCAVVRCAANTTCVDGKCIPNSQQNPCTTVLCPPDTVCKLNHVVCVRAPCPPIPECVNINETRPSRSTPILDKCAVVRCAANTTCIDGKCIPNSQQNLCLSTLCPPNTVCQLKEVVCVRAPCNPIPECVPLNETRPSRSTPIVVPIDPPQQNHPNEPLLTCETVDCIQGRVCRMLVTCLDQEKPCPPKPQCVPVTDDLQINDRMFRYNFFPVNMDVF